MRIDKYLKISRIIKRRTIAGEACDQGRVSINDKVVKAGAQVKVGDIIQIKFGDNMAKYEVTDIKEHVKKEEVSLLYRIVE
ncbi:MAG: RNA-binding protein [Epulopiscium sp. Nele67-Bin004]|nr:MAG: RNA-binding protein [Epulopiscium sp. Nele67-Bin004]